MPSYSQCECGAQIRADNTRCRLCHLQAANTIGIRDYGAVSRVGNTQALISDVHVPLHSPKILNAMLTRADEEAVRSCVIAGDFLDLSEISRFMKGAEAETPEAGLQSGADVLKVMLEVFRTITIIKGNHELRIERTLDEIVNRRSSIAAWLAKKIAPQWEALAFADRYIALMRQCTEDRIGKKLAARVTWLPQSEIEVEGPHGHKPWRIIHQRNGSRNAPQEALAHWQRHQQPIITTHTHLVGYRLAPNGVDPLINLGMSTVENAHEYCFREPGGYPKWVGNYALLIKGRISLHTQSPYWREP